MKLLAVSDNHNFGEVDKLLVKKNCEIDPAIDSQTPEDHGA